MLENGMKTVKDLMTTEVFSVRSDWSLEKLTQFFFDKPVSGAPVVGQDDRLEGVVSVTDLVRAATLPPNASQSAGHAHDYYLHTTHGGISQDDLDLLRVEAEDTVTVKDIMTPMIFEVEEETSIKDAAELMLKGHIHRVFVTRDKKMIGVVTTMDMLKVICEKF
jgi:predicted transcriptional regulator